MAMRNTYGFNYYGTVGSNRDEFIAIRKMSNINWLDDEGRDQVAREAKMKIRHKLVHGAQFDKWLPYLRSVTCKNV